MGELLGDWRGGVLGERATAGKTAAVGGSWRKEWWTGHVSLAATDGDIAVTEVPRSRE